jgi:hypothetical protein
MFSTVVQPAGMPAGLKFDVIYNPTLIQLQVVSGPFFAADFDHSGAVDADDLAQWQTNFGLNADSDADGDGDSDGSDFLAWQRQLGSTTAAAATDEVPEPSTWVLLCLAAAGGSLTRRGISPSSVSELMRK